MLIQVSILLTVASLLVVAILPSSPMRLKAAARTVDKMNTVLTALRQYQAVNGVLPCPADPTQPTGSSSYGIAAANPGTTKNCTGGSPSAAYADASQHVAIGMVPVRTLGLPYDYALDAYGRDITYAVDTNMTALAAALCNYTSLPGTITVNDNGNNHNTVVALVSHGQDGYGAWLPMQGSSNTALRFNNGSTDAAQADNAQVQHGGGLTPNGASQFQSFVQKNATSTFDDYVIYSSTQFVMNTLPQAYVSSSAYTTAHNTYCTCSPAYRTITIDHTKVPNSDQSNFPMLFAGTYSYLAAQDHGGQVQSANGYDIKFTSDMAGTHILPYEQESYDPSTGTVNYWILLDSASPYNITLSHTTDTVIYLQYCTANQTDQSNPAAVWTTGNNYQGVWHFGSGVSNAGPNFSTTPVDSSNTNSKVLNGQYSYTGTPASILSPFGTGSGANFSNGYMQFGLNATYGYFQNSSAFTVEFWADKTASSASKVNDWGVGACDLAYTPFCSWGVLLTSNESTNYTSGGSTNHGTNDCPSFLVYSTSGTAYPTSATGSNCLTIGNWEHIVATRNGNTNTLYVNGVRAAQITNAPTTLSNTGWNAEFWAMRDSGPSQYISKAAYIDELRFSPTAYSADWISAEYNNQSWPDKAGTAVPGSSTTSGFYTVGAAVGR